MLAIPNGVQYYTERIIAMKLYADPSQFDCMKCISSANSVTDSLKYLLWFSELFPWYINNKNNRYDIR